MDKLKQAVDKAAEKHEKLEWWQSKSDWEFDKYFSPVEDCYMQEHIIYKRRPNGSVERITITRHYFSDGDYQDSTETVIL